MYLALGVVDKITDPAHPTEVHSVLLGMYECLDTTEKAGILGRHHIHLTSSGAIQRATVY